MKQLTALIMGCEGAKAVCEQTCGVTTPRRYRQLCTSSMKDRCGRARSSQKNCNWKEGEGDGKGEKVLVDEQAQRSLVGRN